MKYVKDDVKVHVLPNFYPCRRAGSGLDPHAFESVDPYSESGFGPGSHQPIMALKGGV
jgi:hypothetical protein